MEEKGVWVYFLEISNTKTDKSTAKVWYSVFLCPSKMLNIRVKQYSTQNTCVGKTIISLYLCYFNTVRMDILD